jgi:hypothetical protein
MFFSRSGGLMRSALCGSYSTPKNLASAAPIAGSFTWNSSIRMSSTFLFLRRAALVARSSSPAAITLSITRYSNFDCTEPGICWRTRKAIASVFGELDHALVVQRENGWPGEVVDELDHAHQLAAGVRRPGSERSASASSGSGALVDRLQEREVGRVRLSSASS